MRCTCYLRRFALAREPLFHPSAARRNFTNTLALCSNPPPSPPASSTTPTFSTPFATTPPKNKSEKKEEGISSPSSTSDPLSPSTLSDAEDELPVPQRSNTKAGEVMRGLNYFKDKPNPIAGADDEYPDWLWQIAEEIEAAAGKKSESGTKADMYSKSKKKRRQAMQTIRDALSDPNAGIVPYEEQTIDLPTSFNDLDTAEHQETEHQETEHQEIEHQGTKHKKTKHKTKQKETKHKETKQKGGLDKSDRHDILEMQHEAQKARDRLVHVMRRKRRNAIKESNFLKSMK